MNIKSFNLFVNALFISISLFFYKEKNFYHDQSLKYYQKFVESDMQKNQLSSEVASLSERIKILEAGQNEKLSEISKNLVTFADNAFFQNFTLNVFEIIIIIACSVFLAYAITSVVNQSANIVIDKVNDNNEILNQNIHQKISHLAKFEEKNAEVIIKNTNESTKHLLDKMNSLMDMGRTMNLNQATQAESFTEQANSIRDGLVHIQNDICKISNMQANIPVESTFQTSNPVVDNISTLVVKAGSAIVENSEKLQPILEESVNMLN